MRQTLYTHVMNRRLLRSCLFLLLFANLAGCASSQPAGTPTSQQSQSYPDCSQQGESLALLPKRVAVLHFSVNDAMNRGDLPQLGEIYGRQFVDALNQSDRFLVTDATDIDLTAHQLSPLGQPLFSLQEQVKEIARRTNSQLVFRGRFHKTGTIQPGGVVASIFQSSKRHIVMDLAIYDGFTGTLFQQIQSERLVSGGSITEGRSRNLPQQDLQDPLLTAALESLLTEQIEISYQISSCLPLGGRIISADGDQIFINLGRTSRIKVGDRFKIIHSRLVGTSIGGVEELRHHSGRTITITSVQSNMAQGSTTEPSESLSDDRIEAGDYVLGL